MTEPTKEQQEVIALLENVIRVGRRNDVYIAGFAFAAAADDHPAMLINFGNCSDCHELRLFEQLVEARNSQIRKGTKIEKTLVGEVN